MSAREEILRRIAVANGPSPADVEVARDYVRAPDVRGPAAEDVVTLLEERLRAYGTRVVRVASAGIADAVDAALGDARDVVVPPGLDTAWVHGGSRTVVTDSPATSYQALDAADAVVTAASVACAETGTIALDAGHDQGRRAVSLIPDRHVCVVRTDQVVQTVPQLVGRLDPTRPTTLFSGPSATVDIELERVQGVHGPRDLHVVIVE
ncbi:LutC/YkgG family protein [Mumia zhuanghuii]|uniref:Lactate utilization protein C n=1 Tax=Mumia zhuanghuii TaxID=2585211 RepID=A0A5C4MP16_9ACTN|nr:LUD domain-containing protein [Mumia zhuanghuii]TNC36581.1 lactate utilization protein C [Mumia zhuanghuii]TNC46366.1 lactate utilization protein C [Mumia zhuanghuii]